MSTTVIGPYEDDDPTEACSTIHHEAIGATTTLIGGDDVPLAPLTTFKVGGPARHLVIATTNDELLQTVRDCDRRGEPCLVLGGGSNVLVGDDGFDGTVVRVATSGLSSGIPGLVGSTPIQNVGAYGVEVCEFIARVRTWDRVDDTQRTFTADQCGFGYRSSRFKAEPDRYVVLDVTMQFNLGTRSLPVRYAELARRLGVESGERANTSEVRETVLEVRGGKGMVLNLDDHDTWSAGSFFTNPLVAPDEPDGRVKTSAAWLIDHAGYGKGFMVAEDSPASLSTKHVLALTNRGSASSDDLTALARTIIEGVRDAYGITLVPEPRLVGCAI